MHATTHSTANKIYLIVLLDELSYMIVRKIVIFMAAELREEYNEHMAS
jgi:hypothetical protein